MRSRKQRQLSALTLVTTLLFGLAWLVELRPSILGGPTTYVVVRGDSMVPTYVTGDLVVLHSAPVYRVGQIVAYRVPQGQIGAGHLVIHRIVGGDGVAGFDVKGDNNSAPDPWRPRAADVVGSAWLLVHGVGRALVVARSPATVAAALAGVVVAVILFRAPPGEGSARQSWRPSRRRRRAST
jgi:signal peptidase